MLGAGTAALLASVALTFHRPTVPQRAQPPAREAIEVRGAGARWSRADEPRHARLRLEEGRLDIDVDARQPHLPLVVELPDGELSDLGTVFRVEVRHGHTVAVSVSAGAVVLTLSQQAPVYLAAGHAWSAPVASLPAAPPAPPAPPPPAAVASTPARHSGPAVARADPELDEAMAAFHRGDDSAAAAAFELFLAHHPDDPRAEDASYLLVLARQRAGDEPGTRAAARLYLERFPAALRRTEVERLVNPSE
jgi:hypothetical protein